MDLDCLGIKLWVIHLSLFDPLLLYRLCWDHRVCNFFPNCIKCNLYYDDTSIFNVSSSVGNECIKPVITFNLFTNYSSFNFLLVYLTGASLPVSYARYSCWANF